MNAGAAPRTSWQAEKSHHHKIRRRQRQPVRHLGEVDHAAGRQTVRVVIQIAIRLIVEDTIVSVLRGQQVLEQARRQNSVCSEQRVDQIVQLDHIVGHIEVGDDVAVRRRIRER